MIRAGLLIAVLLSGCAPAFAGPFVSKWDAAFAKHADTYLPGVDWRLLKAQCYQESRLRPEAVSPVGAAGVCQFMPPTWREARAALGFEPGASVYDPLLNIEAGAWYMGRLRKTWRSPRPERDRHSLALASYNAGAGHILRAQRLCGNPSLYDPIMACLPQVTGRHAAETLGYAPAIYRHYQRMVLE